MPKLLTNLDANNVGRIVNLPNPVNPGDVANKAYVDNVAQGLQPKASARYATTGVITLAGLAAQANGDWSGVLTAGDRILVKNQTGSVPNGIYVAASGSWTRAVDLAAGAQAKSAFIFIEEGTTLADTGWVCTSDGAADTVGTDPLTFVQFSGAGMITAGDALQKTGNELDVLFDNSTIGLNPSNQLEVKSAVRFASHKFAAEITGNGSATEFTVTHGLATPNLNWVVREGALVATTGDYVIVLVENVDANNVKITFVQAPTGGTKYTITVIG